MSDKEIAAHYRNAKYPKQDIKILAELYAVPREEILAALKREGIEVKITNPKGRSLQMPADELVMKLYKQRLTDAEIARRLGVKRGSVAKWRKEKGLPLACPACGSSDEEKRMELYQKGYGDLKIAIELGCSQSCISRWRWRKGLAANGRIGRQKQVEIGNDEEALEGPLGEETV